jgi:hypothetical protein
MARRDVADQRGRALVQLIGERWIVAHVRMLYTDGVRIVARGGATFASLTIWVSPVDGSAPMPGVRRAASR